MPYHPNAMRALRLRHAPPLRQQDLADRLGLTKTMICRYERGRSLPSLPRALEIAIALRTPVERVFFGLFEAAGDRVRPPQGGAGER